MRVIGESFVEHLAYPKADATSVSCKSRGQLERFSAESAARSSSPCFDSYGCHAPDVPMPGWPRSCNGAGLLYCATVLAFDYRWWVFIHLAGVFGFLLAHGASVSALFRLR